MGLSIGGICELRERMRCASSAVAMIAAAPVATIFVSRERQSLRGKITGSAAKAAALSLENPRAQTELALESVAGDSRKAARQ